jgi:hypothetical protein
MIDKKQNLAAPCGLYCGACIIYCANKRGDSKFLRQIREQLNKRLSALRKGERLPGMPPPPKIFKPAQMQKDLQREESLYCEGCLSDMLAFPCRNCGFRECALERDLTNCSQCLDSPCQLLIDFNNDGVPHHGEVLDNIERQKEIGMDAWLVEQEKRWCCVQCGSPLGWYDAECPSCGAKQSQTSASPSPL